MTSGTSPVLPAATNLRGTLSRCAMIGASVGLAVFMAQDADARGPRAGGGLRSGSAAASAPRPQGFAGFNRSGANRPQRPSGLQRQRPTGSGGQLQRGEAGLRTGTAGQANRGSANGGFANRGNANSGVANRGTGNGNGNGNAAAANSGNANTGTANGNSNRWTANSGNANTGVVNSGNGNSGVVNAGNGNAGVVNSGNVNNGRINTGNVNTGDVNVGNNVDVDVDTNDWPAGTGAAYATGVAVGATTAAAAATPYYAYALPSGCTSTVINGHRYYSCGGTWYQQRYESGAVVYVVVSDPH